jgi:hypothetical protein
VVSGGRHPCLAGSDAGFGRPSAADQVEARPDVAAWEDSGGGRIGAACAPTYIRWGDKAPVPRGHVVERNGVKPTCRRSWFYSVESRGGQNHSEVLPLQSF